MAYNNNYNSYNNQRQPSRGGFTPAPAAPVEPKAIPANYVDLAETLMSANSKASQHPSCATGSALPTISIM